MYQRILFKNIQTCGLVLQSLSRVAEKESNIKDAQLFLETVIKLNTLFEFENHEDACAYNWQNCTPKPMIEIRILLC